MATGFFLLPYLEFLGFEAKKMPYLEILDFGTNRSVQQLDVRKMCVKNTQFELAISVNGRSDL